MSKEQNKMMREAPEFLTVNDEKYNKVTFQIVDYENSSRFGAAIGAVAIYKNENSSKYAVVQQITLADNDIVEINNLPDGVEFSDFIMESCVNNIKKNFKIIMMAYAAHKMATIMADGIVDENSTSDVGGDKLN